jgi:hypothetical protein
MEMVLFKARAWHPRDPLILFKLACCASVTGRIEEAKLRLGNAIDLDEKVRRLALHEEDLRPLWDWIAQTPLKAFLWRLSERKTEEECRSREWLLSYEKAKTAQCDAIKMGETESRIRDTAPSARWRTALLPTQYPKPTRFSGEFTTTSADSAGEPLLAEGEPRQGRGEPLPRGGGPLPRGGGPRPTEGQPRPGEGIDHTAGSSKHVQNTNADERYCE